MGPRSVILATVLGLTACSEQTPTAAPVATSSPTSSPTASPTSSPTPHVTLAPVRRTPTASPKPKATPKVTSSPTPRPPATCPRVPAVGSATQVVLVVGSGSSAVIRGCERRGGQWVSLFGKMYGHVGLRGVAPAGAKRDVWVDDSGSSLYNTRQRKPANGRWDSAEKLYVPGTYDYVQVIDDNTARVPGRGSGIFLHVDHQSGTHGCVSVPRSQLLALFRWERPGAVVVIR